MSIKNLREEYKIVVGKNPYHGWNEEQLREKISAVNEFPLKSNEGIPVSSDPTPVSTRLEELRNKTDLTEEEATERENMEEALRINVQLPPKHGDELKRMEDLIPVHIGGVAHCLWDGKYVLYEEGEMLRQMEVVKYEQSVLDGLEEDRKTRAEQSNTFTNTNTGKRMEQGVL